MGNFARALVFGVVAFVTVAGCGGGAGTKSPVGEVICDDKRHGLDCESEVRYQGVKTEGGVHVLNIAGGNAAFADTALRQINGEVEKFIISQTRRCRDYNACVLTPQAYLQEASHARERFEGGISPLVDRVNTGDASAADQLLADVGNVKGGPALKISVTLDAVLPDSVGGGTKVIAPNFPLPTNSKIAFNFTVNQTAHVYLFQIDAEKKVSVLFPDDRIATRNPLPAGRAVQIPEKGLRFRVDDKGIGAESVYFVASARPLGALEQTLKRYASGQAQEVRQDALMADIAGAQGGAPAGECATRSRNLVLDDDTSKAARASAGCTRTRGLVLDSAPEPNRAASHSLEARAAAGDDVIVKFFPFQHVTEQDFTAKLAAYNAPGAAGMKTRGISIEGFH
jgi:hypothetical protein